MELDGAARFELPARGPEVVVVVVETIPDVVVDVVPVTPGDDVAGGTVTAKF